MTGPDPFPQGGGRQFVNALHQGRWSRERRISFHAPGRPPERFALAELQTMVLQVADFLRGERLERGDRIGIMSRNCLEWVLLDLAALRLGLQTAGLEPEKFARRPTLAHDYDLARLFHDDASSRAARGAGERAVAIDALRFERDEPRSPARFDRPPERYAPQDATTVKFTSGSTGEAKGLAATVASIDQSLEAVQEMFAHSADDRIFIFLPLSLLQQRYWIYSAIAFGHDVCVTTPALALQALRLEHPTVIMGVPAFFETLKSWIETAARSSMGRPDGEATKTAARKLLGDRVRYLWTGSAPARPDVLRFFEERCGIPIYEGYGMNETCIVTKNHPGSYRRGSVGRPVRGMSVAIGEDGTVRVTSRNPVGHAYLFAPPGASQTVFASDGSVMTGDLGHIDDDGFLYIHGRADDRIVLENGRNVDVRPVEEKLAKDPQIAGAIVFGSGRRHLGALVAAVPGTDRDALAARIRQIGVSECGEAVRAVAFAEEPFSLANGLLTSQGKPRRRAILERYLAQIQSAYGEP